MRTHGLVIWGSLLGPNNCSRSGAGMQSRAFSPIAGRQRLHGGFRLGAGLVDRVARNRDVWRVGLWRLVDDEAALGQGVQHNIEGRVCLVGLAEGGTDGGDRRDYQEAEAGRISFHGHLSKSKEVSRSRPWFRA